MSESAAKRRRTSPTTFVPGDAPESRSEPSVDIAPEVSHRTSFQSPTRSSLARSNPDVLSNVLRRSPVRSPSRPPSSGRDGEGGGAFGLRDRKALRSSLIGGTSTSPQKAPQLSSGFPILSPQRRPSAFTAPPRRVLRRSILLDAPTITSSNAPHTGTITPTPADNPDEQLAHELDSATREPEILSNPTVSVLQDEEGEPDLPPTPTQLGLERPPGRPKGLLSSPSRQYETRRNLRREVAGLDRQISPEVVSEEVRKKLALRDELSQQLKVLQNDVAQLEDWALLGEEAGGGSEVDVLTVQNFL
jgi:hypothetical protein